MNNGGKFQNFLFEALAFLLCLCRILRGSGQVVDGDKGVIYTHKDISL